MKTHFLFPHRFKAVGWCLLGLGIVGLSFSNLSFGDAFSVNVFAIADGGVLDGASYFSIVENDIYDELVLACLIIGGILIGFSRCREEDELIAQIRYESLVWAVYLNFGLLLLATLFIYGTYYMSVVMHNIFSLLIFFIIRFHIKLFQLKSLRDDE